MGYARAGSNPVAVAFAISVGCRVFFYYLAHLRSDSLAERSKAPDSSSGGAIRVGSNPTAVKFLLWCAMSDAHRTNQHEERRSCGVTVSTLDSESSDGGSNPPRTFWR